MRDTDFLTHIQEVEQEVESSLNTQREEYVESRINEIKTRVLISATDKFLGQKFQGTPLDVAERITELEQQSAQDLESNPPWYAPFTQGLKVAFGIEGAKMPEYKPGMSRKEILWQVANEALNNPRYKEILDTSEAGALGAQNYSLHILKQVSTFENRLALIKGRMLELQRDGATVDEAFDQANSEIPKSENDLYEAPRIAEAALKWKQNEFVGGIWELASDPWVWGPAIIAAPLSTAVALRGAGLATGWLANPISKAGAAAVFSDAALSAAFMPLESLTQDALIEHPKWALAASFGMWGAAFGPMIDTFAASLIKDMPGLTESYARKYAEQYIAKQVRKGKIHTSVAKALDPLLSDIVTKAEALNKFDGTTIANISDNELKARGLVINASALEAAQRIATKSEQFLKKQETIVADKEMEWQAAEKALETAKQASASKPLISKLQSEAALAKQIWLNEKATLSNAKFELARNKIDIERLQSVVDITKPEIDDVPIEYNYIEANGAVNEEAVLNLLKSSIGRKLTEDEYAGFKTWLTAFENAKRELGEPITHDELAEAISEITSRINNAR